MVYWDQTTECKTLRIHSYLDELLLMLRQLDLNLDLYLDLGRHCCYDMILISGMNGNGVGMLLLYI